MKCIYCDTNNTYRDRRNGKCKKCGKPFAFEPRNMDRSLTVTDKRFQSAINAVSGGGRLFFTSRQLYYQVIRREGRAPIRYHDFQVKLQHRWIQAHGRPEKLLESPASQSGRAASAEPDIHQYSFDRLLVVDRAETAHMLLANNLHFETSMPILSADGYPRDVFTTVMTMVRRNPHLRVFVLHDADAEGCRLPLLLRERTEWFPSPDVTVLDLGLRPMQIAATPKFVEQKDDPLKEIPPELTRNLSPGERRWLAAGNRGELAFFPPDRIMKTIYRMIQSAERQAGAVRRWAAFDLRGFCQSAMPGARFAGFAREAAQEPAGAGPESALPGGALRAGVSRVSYSDRVVGSDGSVERRYANGVIERRVVAGPGEIAWTDDRGGSGRDYNLGDGQVLRRAASGGSALGRQIGFGITCWNDGARVTVNETPLPERTPEPPPPSFLGRCAAGLGMGSVFRVGAIRVGKRRILPGSDEFPLYAEQAMMRRWMQARRASGAPYVEPGPYFWVSTPAPPPDTTMGYSASGGDGGDGGGGFWGDTSGDAGHRSELGGGWDAQGADSGSWGIGAGWDAAGGGSDAGGGWDGGDGDGFG